MLKEHGLKVSTIYLNSFTMIRKLGVMMQKEKDFGIRLMRRDSWSGLRKRHKDYRHPARVGCIHTKERSKNSVDGM